MSGAQGCSLEYKITGVISILLTMPMWQFNDTLKKIPNGQKVILYKGQTLKLIGPICKFDRR